MKEREINFYGIILSFSVPKFTRRKEWMMQITVTDESICEESDVTTGPQVIPFVTLTVFHRNKDNLPCVFCAGDIIRCHRVLVDVSIETIIFIEGLCATIRAQPKIKLIISNRNTIAYYRYKVKSGVRLR